MAKEFKYDVVQLIEGVRDQPCLWDKTLETYKDRVERRLAWEQIFSVLDLDYKQMSREEKRIMGEHVLNKWTNIRDTFVKSLKTKPGKPRRKYVLHDHLTFLTKVVSIEEEPNMDYTGSDDAPIYFKEEKEIDSSSYKTRKRSKREHSEEYTPLKSCKTSYEIIKPSEDIANEIDFVEVNEDPRVMNEDEAFFASLLPTVVKYSEDERLEFRIEVLAVMKRIKDERNWTGDKS